MEILTYLESNQKPSLIPTGTLHGSYPLSIPSSPANPLALLQSKTALSPLPKRWQFLTLTTPELVFGAGFVDLGYITQFFSHLSLESGCADQRLELALPALQFHLNDRPLPGLRAHYKNPLSQSHFSMREEQGEVLFEGTDPKAGFTIQARFKIQPLTALTVLGEAVPSYWASTVKTACLPLSGSLQLKDGRTLSLDGGFAGLDCTVGFLPRKTQWFWAYALGKASSNYSNGPIGFNFARGNNLGGMNENALWWRDQLIGLPAVRFEKSRHSKKWRVFSEESSDLAVQLEFHERSRLSNINRLGLISSDLVQAYGTFTGTLHLPHSSERIQIENVPGICEDQDVLW